MNTYTKIVTEYLTGSSEQHLQEIVDHGIHNLMNDFSNDEFDFDKISEEFKSVATDLLSNIPRTNA